MYGSLGIFAGLPLIHLFIQEAFSATDDEYSSVTGLFFYLLMGASYLTGLAIYTVKCPEKYKPG